MVLWGIRMAVLLTRQLPIALLPHPPNLLDPPCLLTSPHAHPPLPPACRGRKRWILSVPIRGEVWLDGGAVQAVQDRKKSLFSAGIVSVSGDFHAQDAVRLCDARGAEFARAVLAADGGCLRRGYLCKDERARGFGGAVWLASGGAAV